MNESGTPFFSISFRLEPVSEEIKGSADKSSEEDDKHAAAYEFRSIGHSFLTVMQMLWRYMHSIGGVAEMTSLTNILSLPAFVTELRDREKHADSSEKPLARAFFQFSHSEDSDPDNEIEINLFDYEHFKKLVDFRKFQDIGLRILNETVVQQITNIYEKTIGDILKRHFLLNPDAAPKDKQLTYSQLLSFENLDDAKNTIIDGEIESFFKGKDTDAQFRYLKDELKIDVSSSFPDLPKFKEFFLRRHAIVHGGGLVTDEYLRRASRLNVLDLHDLRRGRIVPLNGKYVTAGWSLVFSVGIVVLHQAAVQCARAERDDDAEAMADGFLSDAAYTCIKNQQYDAAEYILRFAYGRRLKKDTHNRMVAVNLAQTLRWKGLVEESNNVLDGFDWEVCSSKYQVCVAALREDSGEFRRHLEIAAKDGLTRSEVSEWPVFKEVREQKDFESLLDSVFGKSNPVNTKSYEPDVINLQSKNKIDQILEEFNNRTSAPSGSN